MDSKTGPARWQLGVGVIALIAFAFIVVALYFLMRGENEDSQATLLPAQNGLFGDGVKPRTKSDVSAWKTYVNATFGYSFRYPSDWELDETNPATLRASGGSARPIQSAIVRNPLSQRGVNQAGTDSNGVASRDAPPNLLGFYVSVDKESCNLPGSRVMSSDAKFVGRKASMCLFESPSGGSRVLEIATELGGGESLLVRLAKGNQTSSTDQAILETILSTFSIRETFKRP